MMCVVYLLDDDGDKESSESSWNLFSRLDLSGGGVFVVGKYKFFIDLFSVGITNVSGRRYIYIYKCIGVFYGWFECKYTTQGRMYVSYELILCWNSTYFSHINTSKMRTSCSQNVEATSSP